MFARRLRGVADKRHCRALSGSRRTQNSGLLIRWRAAAGFGPGLGTAPTGRCTGRSGRCSGCGGRAGGPARPARIQPGSAVVAIPAASGRHRFEAERRRLPGRHEAVADFLHSGRTFTWAAQVHADRFEQFVRELLSLEPGTSWVRLAGSVNDRNRRRDLLIERSLARVTGAIPRNVSPVVTQRIVGQCEVRRGGVSKAHVPDIIDTVARHNADSYFLAVATHITNDVTCWLEDRGNAAEGWWIWWTRVDLEDRLRRHPCVLTRFADVVKQTPRRLATCCRSNRGRVRCPVRRSHMCGRSGSISASGCRRRSSASAARAIRRVGSVTASHPRRVSPSGPATASPSCSASTPSASRAATRSPASGSKTPSATTRTADENLAPYSPQATAARRFEPDTTGRR